MIYLKAVLSRPFLCSHKLERVSSVFLSDKSYKKTHYATLEVPLKAEQKEIKDAYLRLSKLWHPDVHQVTEETSSTKAESKFREISAAYEILGDPKRRSIYDVQLGIRGDRRNSTARPISQWRPGRGPEHSHEEYRYGVDPAFGRRIDIDLSEERMKKAWEAYKIRWEMEEESRQILEEKKLSFRIQLDKKREMYDHLSEEEKADLKESIRLFRNPFEDEGSSLGQKYNGIKNNPYRMQDSLNRRTSSRQPYSTANCQFAANDPPLKKKNYEEFKASQFGADPNVSDPKLSEFETAKASKEIFEEMYRPTKKDPFVEELRSDEKKFEKENNFEPEFEKDFVGNFGQTFRPHQDPLTVSQVSYSDVFKEMQEKAAKIKKNIDEAQFLSDSGAAGKITSTKSVSKPLVFAILALGFATICYESACNNDPCEGNVFMQQLKEQKRLEQEQLQISASKNANGNDISTTVIK